MPLPVWLAHRLAQRLAQVRRVGVLPYLRPDGKTQVSVTYEDGRPVALETVLISTQHDPGVDLETLLLPDLRDNVVTPLLPPQLDTSRMRLLANPTGVFELGGPHADTGLTGRKIIVDTYGGMARHGGGAFSGKDPSKVDRSAAYACAWVAKNVVAAGAAARCEVQVAYAIGVARPVSLLVETFGTERCDPDRIGSVVNELFDLRPAAIVRDLDLEPADLQEDGRLRALRSLREGNSPGRTPHGRTTSSRHSGSDRHGRSGGRSGGRTRHEPTGRRTGSFPAERGRRRRRSPGSSGWRPMFRPFAAPSTTRCRTRWPTSSPLAAASRVELHGRRVGGWVTEDDVAPTPGVVAKPLALSSGMGPPPSVVRLAEWAAWRWAGPVASFLRTSSPERVVRSLPSPVRTAVPPSSPGGGAVELVDAALASGPRAVMRLPPALDAVLLVEDIVHRTGPDGVLVLAPSHRRAAAIESRLRDRGVPVALLPDGWDRSAAGGSVSVGTRVVAWAPIPQARAAVVLDAHDEAYREQRAPTWSATDVVVEPRSSAMAPR